MSAPKIIEKYKNNRGSVEKSPEIAAIIPEHITECAIFLNKKANEPCSDDATVAKIGDFLNIHETGGEAILDKAMERTNCDSEKCVIKKLTRDLGVQKVNTLLATRFKLEGPTDNSLLNNYNIDDNMKLFSSRYPEFFPYNFNMRNYREFSFSNGRVQNTPDTLETIMVADLIKKGFKCCGVVINTDLYENNGQHWMAMFADWRDPSKSTVEFFNSSGNSPQAEFVLWMERTRDALMSAGMTIRPFKDYSGKMSDLARVTNRRHQQSTTECGLYSLFYIYSRLCGIKPEFYMTHFIPDQLMFEFRQHMFSGENNFHNVIREGGKKKIVKFNWDEYSKKVKIGWEPTP